MPSVKRLHQAFLRAESQEGVGGSAANVFTAARADLLVIDPFLNVAKENFARSNVNRPSVSPLQPLAGLTTCEGGFGVELTTTKSTDAPGWGLAMQACGMRQTTLYAVTVSSMSPASGFEAIGAGERITQATTNAAGYLVHTLRDGSPDDTHAFIRLDDDSATPNGSAVWTSADSEGNFTPGSVATDVGYCWTPASFGYQTSACGAVDADVTVGEIVTGQTTGAVGVVVQQTDDTGASITIRRLDGYFSAGEDVSFSGASSDVTLSGGWSQSENVAVDFGFIEDGRRKHGKGMRGSWKFSGELGSAGRVDFDMKGLLETSNTGDGGAVGGVTFTAEVPPVLLGVGFTVGKDTENLQALTTPRLQSVNFDHGSEVNIPRDATETEGVYDGAYITGRSSSGSMNIAVAPESVYPWIARMTAGDPVAVMLTLASPTDSDKVLRLEAPGCLITAESGGDQTGFATVDMTLELGSRGVTGLDITDAELILSYQKGTSLPS